MEAPLLVQELPVAATPLLQLQLFAAQVATGVVARVAVCASCSSVSVQAVPVAALPLLQVQLF